MRLWSLIGRRKRLADFRGCTALIFSRDQGFLNYYQTMIVSLGLTPLTALTSESAMAILRMTPVVLVVVDQGQGTSACRRVLERIRLVRKRAAVLVISPNADSFFRQEALALGATDFLAHPALRDDVLHALLPSYPGSQPLQQSA